jgi:Na+/glutamate symporter
MSVLTHVAVGIGAGSVGFIAGVVVGKNFARPIIDEKKLHEFLSTKLESTLTGLGDSLPKSVAKFQYSLKEEAVALEEAVKKASEEAQAAKDKEYSEIAKHVVNIAKNNKAT